MQLSPRMDQYMYQPWRGICCIQSRVKSCGTEPCMCSLECMLINSCGYQQQSHYYILTFFANAKKAKIMQKTVHMEEIFQIGFNRIFMKWVLGKRSWKKKRRTRREKESTNRCSMVRMRINIQHSHMFIFGERLHPIFSWYLISFSFHTVAPPWRHTCILLRPIIMGNMIHVKFVRLWKSRITPKCLCIKCQCLYYPQRWYK